MDRRLLDIQRRGGYETSGLKIRIFCSFIVTEQAEWEKERQRIETEKIRREDEKRREEAEKQEFEKSKNKRQELIRWLEPFDYHSKHQSSAQLRQEGTCGWLLENAIFEDWRSGSETQFLWLYGIRRLST